MATLDDIKQSLAAVQSAAAKLIADVNTLPTPPANSTFFDDFNTLSLSDTRNPQSGGTWQPAYWYATDGITLPGGHSNWVVNPYNPATPITSLYSVSNSVMQLGVDKTPQVYAAACNNQPYVTGTMTTEQTFRQRFGYFEARLMVPKIQGTGAAFWILSNQDPPEIDICEIVSPEGNNNQGWMSHFGIIDFTTKASTHDWFTWSPGSPFTNYDPSQWHTYAIDWQVDTITVYLDRIAVSSFATPAGYGASCPECFVVLEYDTGVTGSWEGPITDPTLLPDSFKIDYVAVYPRRPW